MQQPKKWKMAVLVWVAIYPAITIIFCVFGKYLQQIPLVPLRTLVVTVAVVPLMVYVLIPFLHRILNEWMSR
jgi:hypothetical protein